MAIHVELLDKLIAFMRTRRGKIATGILATALFIVIFLPYAISYSVRDWLNNNGADQTQVEDVNFNIFTGKLEFINLRITVANDYTLLLKNAWVNTDWLPLFKKTFHIKAFYVEDTDITIEQQADGKLVFGGISPVTEPATEVTTEAKNEQANPWGLGLEQLTILNSRFKYSRPDLKLELVIDKATLTGLHSAKAEAAQFALQGSLNKAPLNITASVLAFAAKPNIKARLSLQNMPVNTFKQIASQHVGIDGGQLAMDINVDASYDENKGVAVKKIGQISLTGIDINQSGSQVKVGNFNWHGSLSAGITPEAATPDIELDGAVGASELAVVNQSNNAELLNVKSLAIDSIKATTSNVHINELKIAKLIANIQRDKEGAIVLPGNAAEAQTAETLATEKLTPTDKTEDKTVVENEETSPAAEFALRIDNILISENSALNFNDSSTTPAFSSVVAIDRLAIQALDNLKPEQATTFSIEGKIGKFSTINANGKAFPFAEKLNLDMTAKLAAVEMPPLSAYTAASLGHYLLNGQVNSDIKVSIKDDIIDANSKLLIGNLEVKELTAEEKKKINTTASAPLGLGISMLSDRDNNIKLDLPFKGDVNDPNIDISDAVNQVIVKAISSAALAYLKLSLQPFGALLAIADVAGDISKGVQLQPVVFPSATTALDANAVQYKEKIATIMTDRPGLRLKVCGIATSRDRNNLAAKELARLKAIQAKSKDEKERKKKIPIPVIPDAKLLELAKLRADNLKGALINDHKIAPDRLFGCLPKIDPEAGTDPRVEVGI